MTYRWRRQREPSGAAVATFYGSDAMTGADTTVITAHTPVAVGANPAGLAWVTTNGAVPDVQLLSNRLAEVGTVASSNRAVMTMTTSAADQSVQADFVMFTIINSQIKSLGARGQTGNVSSYYLQYAPNASTPTLSYFAIFRVDAAFGQTQIGSNYTFAFPSSGTVVPTELRCQGGAISATINGVVNAISGTDASPLTGTLGGFLFLHGTAGDTATTGVHLDNLVIRSPS